MVAFCARGVSSVVVHHGATVTVLCDRKKERKDMMMMTCEMPFVFCFFLLPEERRIGKKMGRKCITKSLLLSSRKVHKTRT